MTLFKTNKLWYLLLLLTSFNHISNIIVRPFAEVSGEVNYFSLVLWFAQLSAQAIDCLVVGASTHIQTEAGLVQSKGDVSNSATSVVGRGLEEKNFTIPLLKYFCFISGFPFLNRPASNIMAIHLIGLQICLWDHTHGSVLSYRGGSTKLEIIYLFIHLFVQVHLFLSFVAERENIDIKPFSPGC